MKLRIAMSVLFLLAGIGPLAAQDVSLETYLDLGRCEGFYTEYLASGDIQEGRQNVVSRLSAVRTMASKIDRPAWKPGYRDAVESGRRAVSASQKLGDAHFSGFVQRRTAHCDALLDGILAGL